MSLPPLSTADRAAGAVLGALIGEALGVGPHWYYDLDQLRADHGDWIDDYTEPKPGRYHYGLKPGQLSQDGIIAVMLLDSILANGGYDEADFLRRLDEDLFPQLTGEPMDGPGGYTSQSIREAWRARQDGKDWSEIGSLTDDTEAAERVFLIAALYAADPSLSANLARDHAYLTQTDVAIVAATTTYAIALAALVRGEKLDPEFKGRMLKLVRAGKLPFHHVTSDGSQPPKPGSNEKPVGTNFPSPDSLHVVEAAVLSALDPAIVIEPASKVAQVYGMPCAIFSQIPAVYYLATRFADDFESAVLHAINGGGQNQARAMLTGALVGAQVGLGGIPQRFIDGLENGEELLQKSIALGILADDFAAKQG